MRYNPANQEVTLKVVYYGPGLAGKTSNLRFLQARVPAGRASELVSVDPHSERTLQFDFLAIELGAWTSTPFPANRIMRRPAVRCSPEPMAWCSSPTRGAKRSMRTSMR